MEEKEKQVDVKEKERDRKRKVMSEKRKKRIGELRRKMKRLEEEMKKLINQEDKSEEDDEVEENETDGICLKERESKAKVMKGLNAGGKSGKQCDNRKNEKEGEMMKLMSKVKMENEMEKYEKKDEMMDDRKVRQLRAELKCWELEVLGRLTERILDSLEEKMNAVVYKDESGKAKMRVLLRWSRENGKLVEDKLFRCNEIGVIKAKIEDGGNKNYDIGGMDEIPICEFQIGEELKNIRYIVDDNRAILEIKGEASMIYMQCCKWCFGEHYGMICPKWWTFNELLGLIQKENGIEIINELKEKENWCWFCGSCHEGVRVIWGCKAIRKIASIILIANIKEGDGIDGKELVLKEKIIYPDIKIKKKARERINGILRWILESRHDNAVNIWDYK